MRACRVFGRMLRYRIRSPQVDGAREGSLRKRKWPWAIGGILATACALAPVQAEDFRIAIEGLHDGWSPDLVLSNLAGSRYAIEASANLRDWFSIHSGMPENGVLRYRYDGADPASTLFYRGVELSDGTELEVVPELDPLTAATTVVTPDEGGIMAMTGPDGAVYTFTVAPDNVIEPVAVRMRLVSGFSAFPYENQRRSAVVFEPDGFEFHGAGELEIRYPEPVEPLKISSFSFNGDGSGFHLVPDTVSPDRVVIPITHFSGSGAAFWEANPRAEAISRTVNNARDGMAHDVASRLARERDRQLAGQEPNPEVMQAMLDRLQEYYDSYLKPYFGEARQNCALAKILIREVLAVERQRQLLGAGGAGQSFLGSEDYAAWICHCIAELIKACEEGRISARTFMRELLGYEKQAQLLGVEAGALEPCGFGSLSDFMQGPLADLPCATEWTGFLRYSDGGTRDWDCAGGTPDYTCSARASASLAMQAAVETAEIVEEFSFPPFYTMTRWRLTFRPPDASGSFTQHQISAQTTACGAVITTESNTTAGDSGPMGVELEFTFENGEMTEFGISSIESLVLDGTQNTTTTATPCEGKEEGGFSNSGSFHPPVHLSPATGSFLEEAVFTQRTETTLEGVINGVTLGIQGISTPYTWTFSLVRRQGSN
ncbi:MAG: hypothetical protein H7A46_10540 [Verrucomicrobiales bacterium]|nr:hypothetical protein [Verrucomicrobiales bacterium]